MAKRDRVRHLNPLVLRACRPGLWIYQFGEASTKGIKPGHPPRAGGSRPSNPLILNARLSASGLLCGVARTKCTEVWLLIVNDEFSRAAPVELSDVAAKHLYAHPFDRLFWLEPHRGRATELHSAS